MPKMRRTRSENLEQYGKIKGGGAVGAFAAKKVCLHMGLRRRERRRGFWGLAPC